MSSDEEDPAAKLDGPDNLRILISSDNNLGYAETDTVRGMDSFAAFEEVLYLAKKFECDMVLIAGNLFHDESPSLNTLDKAMDILGRYCMGPERIQIQFLSDPAKSLHRASTVNYQNKYYSVGLPLFGIHGNQDGPIRKDGSGPLDLLARCKLVNYFGGRQSDKQGGQIMLYPIYLQKGATKIALYGLGNIPDERLLRLAEKKKVRFLRHDDEDECDVLNIFAHHQSTGMPESWIPDWVDITVWGQKHGSLNPDPESHGFYERGSARGFESGRIAKSASTVVTSFMPAEGQRKRISILDIIKGRQFIQRHVPLTQARPFFTKEVFLCEYEDKWDIYGDTEENLDADGDPNIDEKVSLLLDEVVKDLLESAPGEMRTILDEARTAGNDVDEEGSPLVYKLQHRDQPLVRIRVDRSGGPKNLGDFPAIPSGRFGAKFVDKIANPKEILQFYRKKSTKKGTTTNNQATAPQPSKQSNDDIVEDDIVDEFDALFKKKLEAADTDFAILDLEAISKAKDKDTISKVASDCFDRHTEEKIKASKAANEENSNDDGE